MSKKYRHQQEQNSSATQLTHQEEYGIIKHDLVKVVILNVLYLSAVLAIYYTNLHSQYLERWFEKFAKF